MLEESPRSEVLVLTMHQLEKTARDVLQAGTRGYVLKSDADDNLVAAVESLQQHKPFLTSIVAEFVLDDYLRRGDSDESLPHAAVTTRERQLIQLLAEEKSIKEAATALGIGVKTVEAHRANLMRKFHLRSVSDFVRDAIRNNIVEP